MKIREFVTRSTFTKLKMLFQPLLLVLSLSVCSLCTSVETAQIKTILDSYLSNLQSNKWNRSKFLSEATAIISSAPSLQSKSQFPQAQILDHITLHVSNLTHSSLFYSTLFSLAVARTTQDTHYLRLPSSPSSFFGLQQTQEKEQPYIDHFCLSIPNFNATVLEKQLAGWGLQLAGPRNDETVRFRDFDGILVQLCSEGYAERQMDVLRSRSALDDPC